MAEMSPGAVLRQLQQAQAVMKKARQVLAQARGGSADPQTLLKMGFEALSKANQILGEIPISAATDPVLTKQLAVQRYATALLVRLRRIVRNEPGALDGIDDDSDLD
jgi:hypothetical protein